MEKTDQKKLLVDLAATAIRECNKVAKQWRKNIGPPDPKRMHPFGDIVRGMDTYIFGAQHLVNTLRSMLKPKGEEFAMRGLLETCLQHCRAAYAFHDEQVQLYIREHGRPENEDKLFRFAEQAKSAIEAFQLRLACGYSPTSSNRELAIFGTSVKERAKSDPTPIKRSNSEKRDPQRRSKKAPKQA